MRKGWKIISLVWSINISLVWSINIKYTLQMGRLKTFHQGFVPENTPIVCRDACEMFGVQNLIPQWEAATRLPMPTLVEIHRVVGGKHFMVTTPSLYSKCLNEVKINVPLCPISVCWLYRVVSRFWLPSCIHMCFCDRSTHPCWMHVRVNCWHVNYCHYANSSSSTKHLPFVVPTTGCVPDSLVLFDPVMIIIAASPC